MKKPKINEPCNGCGICCMTQICMNGAYVLKLVSKLGNTILEKCPALTPVPDGKFVCGIILNPSKYIKNSKYTNAVLSKNFAHMIGAGTGCDELLPDDSEEEEQKLKQLLETMKNNPEWIKKTKIALKVIHGIEI